MFLIDTRYEAQPRRRFTRPDAHRYLKPVPSPALPDAVAAWARVAERAEEKRRVFERDCRRELDALRYDFASLRVFLKTAKLELVLRKYSPDQPRIPAGQPGGGQWTDGSNAAGTQYAQNRSRSPVAARFPEATPAQEARLAVAEAQADSATAAVRQIDPNWRGSYSLTDPRSVEGAIASANATTQEVRDRLDTLNRLGLMPESLRPEAEGQATEDILAPGRQRVGERAGGVGNDVYTVTTQKFEFLREQLLLGAKPAQTDSRYPGLWFDRSDGVRFGLRWSQDYGSTIDVINSRHPLLENGFKWHQK